MNPGSGYLKGWQFWFLTLTAGSALVLVVINVILARSNQNLQVEVNARQQYINQTIRISRLNGQVIQALANMSARTGDEQLRQLLAAHGISFSATLPAAGTATADGKSPGKDAAAGTGP